VDAATGKLARIAESKLFGLLQGFTAPTPLTRQGLSFQGRLGAVAVCCIGRRGELHDIARLSEKKLALLRPFLPFADGGPPQDRLDDIFFMLDAQALERCFVE
jgi:hypothetical protein